MERSKEIERALQWCYGMDYAHAYDAINAYCGERNLTWKRDVDGIIVYVSIAYIDAYEKRVRELEAEGCTRSDAQAIVDAENA